MRVALVVFVLGTLIAGCKSQGGVSKEPTTPAPTVDQPASPAATIAPSVEANSAKASAAAPATSSEPPAPSAAATAEAPPTAQAARAPVAGGQPNGATTAATKPTATTAAPAAAPASGASKEPATAAKYSGDSPCTATSFKFQAVRSACERGGRPEVKALMKQTTKKASAAGTELKCTSCHSDQKSYQLKDNAVTDLRKWL